MAHYGFSCGGESCELSFTVHGGTAEVILVAEDTPPPSPLGNVSVFHNELANEEYGKVIGRVAGPRRNDIDVPVCWDLSPYTGESLRLYVVDSLTGGWGFISVSQFTVTESNCVDCNGNGNPDDVDIQEGVSGDCNADGVPDECEPDCNANGTPDSCDISDGISTDCNANGIPDACEAECNGNGVPDECDIAAGTSLDADGNGIPDECDVWSDSFDSYVAGSTLIGQGSWAGWDNATNVNADISDQEAFSEPSSLRLRNNTDVVQLFRGVDSGRRRIRAKVFVPSNHRGSAYLILLDQYRHGGPYHWAAQIRLSEGFIQFHDGDGAAQGERLPLVTDEWSEVRVDIDLEANRQEVFYNDRRLRQTSWQTGGINEMQVINLFSEGSSPVYFDDVSLESIVELPPDCNGNGVPDDMDIAGGDSRDCNLNALPDECESCVFPPAVSFGVGDGATSLMSAPVQLDLNGAGDGVHDLAVASFSANSISLLKNRGDGTFAPFVSLPVGSQPTSVIASDLNGDRFNDLVSSNRGGRSISVLLNDGDGSGSFGGARHHTVNGEAFAVTAGDLLDGDGDMDLAAVGGNSVLWVFRNDGGGNFTLVRNLSVGALPQRVEAVDLDGTGGIDLVTGNNNPVSPVTLLFNNDGGGTFTRQDLSLGEGEASFGVAVGDLDGNGFVDIATTGRNPTTTFLTASIWVLWNQGGRTFSPATRFFADTVVEAITIGDVCDDPATEEDDGLPELIVAGHQESVWILPNLGQRMFGSNLGLAAGDGPVAVVAADLDGRGGLDLAVTSIRSSDVSVFLNRTGLECVDLPPEAVFIRGECNDDDSVDLSDAVCILAWLFLGGPAPVCQAGANVNGDLGVDLSDPVSLLSYLFLGGTPPEPPFLECGPGTSETDEMLGCESSPSSCEA